MTSDAPVVIEIEVAAGIEAIWPLLVDPAKLVRWLGISAELDPRPGGRFRFELFDGQFCSGNYLEVDRHRRVVFTWGWEDPVIPVAPGSTTVTIELHARGEHTLVRLEHRGLAVAMRPLHEDGWRRYLARLGAVAIGVAPAHDPAEPYAGPDALSNPLAQA